MVDRLPDTVTDGELLVRLWRPEDVEALHQAIGENLEHLRPFMAWVSFEPLTIERRLELLHEWQTDWEAGKHAPMVMQIGDQVVGGTGYVRRPDSDVLEIGYWVHVDHLGHGYAARSAALLTTAVFDVGIVNAIEIHHDKANVRSSRVPPRLGFEFVGERPDDIVAPAEVGIDCAWRMTADRWDPKGWT